MTVQELYSHIDGDYDAALKIMMMDQLIGRMIVKLKDDPSCPRLLAAEESMDAQALFEAAHALKGVAANLGLTKLSALAGGITEEYRPGNPRRMTENQVKEKLSEIRILYEKTLAGIQAYEAAKK